MLSYRQLGATTATPLVAVIASEAVTVLKNLKTSHRCGLFHEAAGRFALPRVLKPCKTVSAQHTHARLGPLARSARGSSAPA